MCGIGGLYRFGDTPIRAWQLEMLACDLEYRGNDATGFATMDMDGNLQYWKNNLPAWKAVSSKDFQEWVREVLTPTNRVRIALVHTRKATKGSPYKADNNHPMIMPKGDGGAVVHNGWINNDDALFAANKDRGFKRSCDTDSDIIRALLDYQDGCNPAAIKDMSLMDGCAAVGAIHRKTPDKLLLLRDGNPLMIGSVEDMLFFASDKKAIHNIAKPWVKRHGILQQVHAPDVSFVPMNNKSGWIIGPEGLEYHAAFDCTGRMFRSHQGTSYPPISDYHQRQERFSAAAKAVEEKKETPGLTVTTLSDEPVKLLSAPPVHVSDNPKYVMCPNSPTCNYFLDLESPEFESVPLDMLACSRCNTPLTKAIPISQVN